MQRVCRSFQLLREHFAQHATQAIAAACPLHGTCIGQPFTFARNGRLQQAPGHPAQPPYSHDDLAGHPRQHGHSRRLFNLVCLAKIAQHIAIVMQHLKPCHHTCQLHIDARVAFVQMAHFMGKQGLQFFAREPVERPFGDHNHPIRLIPTGCKGINGLDAGLQHHLRAGHVRCHGHFLRDIEQSFLGKRYIGTYFARTQTARQLFARAHIAAFNPPAPHNHQQTQADGGFCKQRRRRPAKHPQYGTHGSV